VYLKKWGKKTFGGVRQRSPGIGKSEKKKRARWRNHPSGKVPHIKPNGYAKLKDTCVSGKGVERGRKASAHPSSKKSPQEGQHRITENAQKNKATAGKGRVREIAKPD